MTKRTVVGFLIAHGIAGTMILAGIAGAAAAEIKVFSTGAFKEALGVLAPTFGKSSGHSVVTIPGSTDEIIKRLSAGETLDVVIAPIPLVEQMMLRGVLIPDSRVDVAKSGIGVAARMGAPRLDIGSSEAFKKTLLDAKSIVLSAGVSGVYLNGLFRKWGIADQIRSKSITLPGAVPVAAALVRGEVEIGFLQVSELLPVKGIQFLGPLPADIQEMTVVAAVLSKTLGAADAAKAFARFLKSPEASLVVKKTGLEPD
jgi:molybdate transport system substrate-binding protein